MIPYNNSIIVPVDTGYGNIKNSIHSFPTGIAAYKTKPAFEGKILHIGDMYYRIGEGHKEYIPDKTVDEEFRLLTIAAICDECRSCGYYEGNIYLAVGCPTTMLTAQRESTREYFLKDPHIDCEYNSKSSITTSKVDMKEIISVIRTTLEAEIPKLLSVFGSDNHAKTEQENMPVTKSDDTLDDDDIDMDFIGG